MALFYLREEIANSEYDLSVVNDEKTKYFERLEKINDLNKIDIDMLEEQVRYITGYMGEKEAEFIIEDY